MAAKATHISISAADRAALERMALRNDDVGLHARIALGAADERPVAAIARENRASRETVRKWSRRFRDEGIPGLYARKRRPSPSRPPESLARIVPVGPPDALLRLDSGRLRTSASARLRIECAVRDAVALGLAPPGAELPGRAWFAKRFSASPTAVHAAFSALRAQGFVDVRGRSGTWLSPKPPFAGRFLLILSNPNADGSSGICENLERSARETERLRPGVAWTVAWRAPCEEPDNPNFALARAIAEQRFCGVFLRIAHSPTPNWAPGKAFFASIPRVPMAAASIFRGTSVSPLVRELNVSRSENLRETFALCRSRGWRRILLLNSASDAPGRPDPELTARTAASAAGVEIPPMGYLSPNTLDTAGNIRRALALFAAQMRGAGADAILLRRDDLLKPLAAALRAQWGEEAATRIPIVCWSTGTFLSDEGLRVEWRGPDLVSTLSSFMDWCEAVRSGDHRPPEPSVAWRQDPATVTPG